MRFVCQCFVAAAVAVGANAVAIALLIPTVLLYTARERGLFFARSYTFALAGSGVVGLLSCRTAARGRVDVLLRGPAAIRRHSSADALPRGHAPRALVVPSCRALAHIDVLFAQSFC